MMSMFGEISTKSPLRPPYDGHYLIIIRSDKCFTLSFKGREETLSIDRLKAAFITDLTGCKNNYFVTSAESDDLSDKPATETTSSAQTDDNYSSATRVARIQCLVVYP